MKTCDHVARMLAEGSVLPADLAEHARDCAACRRLLAIDRALAPAPRRTPVPGAELRLALQRDHHAAPSRSPWRRALGPLAVTVVTSIAAAWMLVTTFQAPLPDGASLLHLGVAALLFTGALVLLFHRGALGLGPAPRLRWGFVVVSVLLFEGLSLGLPAPAAPEADPVRVQHSLQQSPDHVAGTAMDALLRGEPPRLVPHEPSRPDPLGGMPGCAGLGLALSSLIGLSLLAGARRTVPVAPAASGALAGLAAGLASAMVLQLHAPGEAVHVALGHGFPVVVGVVLGALAGRRTLAP